MRIILYVDDRMKHHAHWIGAFAAGLRANGLPYDIGNYRSVRDCDIAVFWSHKFTDVIARQRKNDAEYICLESGFIGDRSEYASVGWNGLNGRADFKSDDSPPDRFEQLGVTIAPWRPDDGRYALIMGQLPGDQSHKHLNIGGWYKEVIAQLDGVTTLPLMFRPHPMDRSPISPQGLPMVGGPLAEALREARFVVTLNSNSAVDAVLAGVPTITMDEGSMAWPVTTHEIGPDLIMPPREQWAYDLAYSQWTAAEMKNGSVWRRLCR